MGAIDPQALNQEFVLDPTGRGWMTQSFNAKQDGINEVRDEITVTRVAADSSVDPGEVAEGIPVQLLRDALDKGEWDAQAGDQEIIQCLMGGSDGQSLFGFTTQSKAQILSIFTNANWPITRANLIALQTRDGSRAEQLFGSPDAPVSRDDMLAAEEWGQANGQPSLYL